MAQECRASAKEFSRSPSAAEVFLLADCAVTGPQVLAEAWRSLSAPESGALLQLMKTSFVLPDVRLARELLERAEDRSAPQARGACGSRGGWVVNVERKTASRSLARRFR